MAGTLGSGSSVLIKTGDIEDARQRLSPVFGACELRPLQHNTAFGLEFHHVTFESASFMRWQHASSVEVLAAFPQHTICTVLDGQVTFEENGETVTVERSCGAVVPPSAKRRLRWSGDATLIGISILEHDFRRGAAAVLPSSASTRLGGGRQFDLSTYPGKVFSELVEFLLADLENGQSWKGNRTVRLLFDRLIAYSLLRALKDESGSQHIVSGGSLAPRHVKHAEDYIRTHLAEPLDNVRLANVVDVSPRSLYRAFLHFRGITPARYIQDLRLDAAHNLLTAAAGVRDIREIAASTGFKSYPAFWRSYVRKFGVPPSKARGPRGSGDA
ncbi:MAG TPA: AraC family transcriptional regulator [Rhizomicrobium sp.]|jgi:AraC-like DNA-binding protein